MLVHVTMWIRQGQPHAEAFAQLSHAQILADEVGDAPGIEPGTTHVVSLDVIED